MTTGFDVAQMDGWLDSDHLYALNEEASGLSWLLTLGKEPTNIWVDAVRQKVEEVYVDIVIPENANEVLKEGEGAEYVFISHTIKNGNYTVADKIRVITSVATLAAGIGVTRIAVDDAKEATDAVFNRLSFAGETFNGNGQMMREANEPDLRDNVLVVNTRWIPLLLQEAKMDLTVMFTALSWVRITSLILQTLE